MASDRPFGRGGKCVHFCSPTVEISFLRKPGIYFPREMGSIYSNTDLPPPPCMFSKFLVCLILQEQMHEIQFYYQEMDIVPFFFSLLFFLLFFYLFTYFIFWRWACDLSKSAPDQNQVHFTSVPDLAPRSKIPAWSFIWDAHSSSRYSEILLEEMGKSEASYLFCF